MLSYQSCKATLLKRISEKAPGRIQLLVGPRQVGKTTLLLEIEKKIKARSLYVALDSPEASLPGFWERFWEGAEEKAKNGKTVLVLLDEIQSLPEWSALLKAKWDYLSKTKTPIHIVASGSSALQLANDSRESLAGRFERLILTHWSPSDFSKKFKLPPNKTIDLFIKMGAYPGAFQYAKDFARWKAYVRDAIVEPAIGQDIMKLAPIRRPALLRQVFAIAMTSPAQIISLQKIVGQLNDAGAIETVAYYLSLLEEAFLVVGISKFSVKEMRMRASPPKIIILSNALMAVIDSNEPPTAKSDPSRFGYWVENACLALAWNAGQRVRYWREEPYEVDGIIDGSWGKWAIEIKTGRVTPTDLSGLLEFCQKYPSYRPLVLCNADQIKNIQNLHLSAMSWQQFLLKGLSNQ